MKCTRCSTYYSWAASFARGSSFAVFVIIARRTTNQSPRRFKFTIKDNCRIRYGVIIDIVTFGQSSHTARN